MSHSRTIRFAIVALLAASSSLCARANDTGAGPGKTDALATIQSTLKAIDLKLRAAERSQIDIKLKLAELTETFSRGENLPALMAGTLQLLDTNDALGVQIAGLEMQLAKIIDTLVRMQSNTANNDPRLAAIKNALVQARALATRAHNDSTQSDNLHTAIKLLAIQIQEKIG